MSRSVLDFAPVTKDEEYVPTSFTRGKSIFPPHGAADSIKQQWSKNIMVVSNLAHRSRFQYPTMNEVEEDGKKTAKNYRQSFNLVEPLKFDWDNLKVIVGENEPVWGRKMIELWIPFYETKLRLFDEFSRKHNKKYGDDKERVQQLQKFALKTWGYGSDFGIKQNKLGSVIAVDGNLQVEEFGVFTANNYARGFNRLDTPDFFELWNKVDASGFLLHPPFLTSFILAWKKHGDNDVYYPNPVTAERAKGKFSKSFHAIKNWAGDIFLPHLVHPGDEQKAVEYLRKIAPMKKEQAAQVERPEIRNFPAEDGSVFIVSMYGEDCLGVNLKEILPEVYTNRVIDGLRGGFRPWEYEPSTDLSLAGGYKYDLNGVWQEVSQAEIKASFVEKTQKGVLIKLVEQKVEVTYYPGMFNSKPFFPQVMNEKEIRYVLDNHEEIEKAARMAGFPIYGDPKQEKDPWAFLTNTQLVGQPGAIVVPGYESYQAPSEPKSSLFKSI